MQSDVKICYRSAHQNQIDCGSNCRAVIDAHLSGDVTLSASNKKKL